MAQLVERMASARILRPNLIAFFLMVALAGCQTAEPYDKSAEYSFQNITVINSVIENDIRYESTPGREFLAETGVSETATGPNVSDGGKRIIVMICMKADFDPPAREETAKQFLKRVASRQGYSAVHGVVVSRRGPSFGVDCWQTLTANGIAY